VPQAKQVTLQTHGKDKYGRTLADVFLLDGTNVNHTLVEDGWCWWYRKYAPRDVVLEGMEKEAREAKQGLWVDPQPVPPWEWRSGVDDHAETGMRASANQSEYVSRDSN
jgi:micrococcal nuclease